MSCDIVITLKHEAIIRFFFVMACILFHSTVVSTSLSLLKGTDLRVIAIWASNVVTTDTRISKNAVFSHL